jgi:hypothetical protein
MPKISLKDFLKIVGSHITVLVHDYEHSIDEDIQASEIKDPESWIIERVYYVASNQIYIRVIQG